MHSLFKILTKFLGCDIGVDISLKAYKPIPGGNLELDYPLFTLNEGVLHVQKNLPLKELLSKLVSQGGGKIRFVFAILMEQRE